MDDYRKRQISSEAENQVKSAGYTALPICPTTIAEAAGITVQAKPPTMKGASGWLVKQGESFGILYATYLNNEGFERFSIGHELGHYFLSGHPEHVFRDGSLHQSAAGFGSKDPIELEADYFSACLLMPTKLFKREMDRFRDGLKAVEGLQGACKTSLEATAIRYAEHTKAAVAVVLSKDGVVQYSVLSDELKEFTRERLYRRSGLPAGSITYRLCRSGDIDRDSDEVSPDEWFSDMRGTCTEEALRLGNTGRVLTMITFDPDDEDEGLDPSRLTFRK